MKPCYFCGLMVFSDRAVTLEFQRIDTSCQRYYITEWAHEACLESARKAFERQRPQIIDDETLTFSAEGDYQSIDRFKRSKKKEVTK